MPTLYITDRYKCKHKNIKIPGLDGFLCGDCNNWVISDKDWILHMKTYDRNEKKRLEQKRKREKAKIL